MPVGIGIDMFNGVGRSPLDDRLMVRSEYHNLGVVMGCKVSTSSTGMSYSVGVGSDPVSVAIGSRSGADGATKFIVPTGSVQTTAAPASGARIDIVYGLQRDPEKGDPDNQSIIGVVQGAAGASPVAPSLPAGAVELARYQVPQGATSTSAATLVSVGDRAIPYGASMGVVHKFTDTFNGKPTQTMRTLGAGSVKIPTERVLEFRLQPTISSEADTKSGSVYVKFMLDGKPVAGFEMSFDRFYQTQMFTKLVTVPAGTHSVSYTIEHAWGDPYVTRYGTYDKRTFSGTTFEVFDQGVA